MKDEINELFEQFQAVGDLTLEDQLEVDRIWSHASAIREAAKGSYDASRNAEAMSKATRKLATVAIVIVVLLGLYGSSTVALIIGSVVAIGLCVRYEKLELVSTVHEATISTLKKDWILEGYEALWLRKILWNDWGSNPAFKKESDGDIKAKNDLIISRYLRAHATNAVVWKRLEKNADMEAYGWSAHNRRLELEEKIARQFVFLST